MTSCPVSDSVIAGEIAAILAESSFVVGYELDGLKRVTLIDDPFSEDFCEFGESVNSSLTVDRAPPTGCAPHIPISCVTLERNGSVILGWVIPEPTT